MSSSHSQSWTGKSVLLIGNSNPRFPGYFEVWIKGPLLLILYLGNDTGKDGEVDQVAETLSSVG